MFRSLCFRREFWVGYVHDKTYNLWSYGARIKLLAGMSVLHPNVHLGIETGSNVEFISLSLSGNAKVSFPFAKSYDENDNTRNISSNFEAINYLLGVGNWETGIDFSARYRGFPDWEFDFCVANVGFVRWNKNLNGMDANGIYTWKRLDLSAMLEPNGFKNFLDEVKSVSVKDSIFSELGIADNHKPFITTIPTSVLWSAKYMLSKNVDVAIIDRIFYADQFVQNSLAVSGNLKIGKYLTLSTGFLIQKNTFGDIMFGCGINQENVSFYMGSDNIVSFFNPDGVKNFSLSFGLNYRFVYRDRIKKELIKNMPFFRT
ncbi:MAG: DUF5723 family protein [Prolixibacteraceae bacterium]|jgi:hypothetical protein|nr:DUF5723 family protein [Prolixibacteraceae bacterium]